MRNLKPKGQLDNLESVTKEVQLMMDPSADPYAAQQKEQKMKCQRNLEPVMLQI